VLLLELFTDAGIGTMVVADHPDGEVVAAADHENEEPTTTTPGGN